MRSVDDIITRARYRTKNSNYTYNASTGVYSAGVSSELFLDALNDAQDHLQAKLVTLGTNLFIIDEVKTIVADQGEYSLSTRSFGNAGIVNVFYNPSNNTTDYGIPLKYQQPRDRRFFTGYPVAYTLYGNSATLALTPIPESGVGFIKVSYQQELNDLDVRRGKISGTPATTDIVLAASGPTPDQYEIEGSDYICVTDRYGTQQLTNGLFSSYDSGTRTITLAANVSTYLETGVTLADLDGSYVTVGKYTTTHSKLPDICERYLRTYAQKRVMTTRESNTSIEEDQELLKMEGEILEFYSDENRDVDEFPILDFEVIL